MVAGGWEVLRFVSHEKKVIFFFKIQRLLWIFILSDH